VAFLADSSRTEKATPKRRREARKRGQIARSPKLVAAIVFVGGIVALSLQAPLIVQNLSSMLRRVLSNLTVAELTDEGLQKLFLSCAMDIAGAVFMVTGTAIVLGVAANMAQGGLVLSTYRLGLRFENLNPVTGFKKLMPGTAGGELAKSLFTVGAVAFTAYMVYAGAVSRLPRLVFMSPGDIASTIAAIVFEFSMKCGVLLLLLGAVDYYLNRRRVEKSIRMTKQEVKDEARNAEGNPEIRSRIRRRQREIALRSMMADIPKADVIITNPTHYAVALRYKPESMSAPVVVAKGKGYVALRIREIAQEHKVPFVENKPLARALFKSVEIGKQIPVELFKAVAEVLAYVYRLRSMRL
jgi:flagellar biosynthetic protein FlhB